MPIIQGPHTTQPAPDFTAWGLAKFPAGGRNITEPHFHDCDEFVFMIEGRMRMRSEAIDYELTPGDVLVTRMGDVHEVTEIIEDTVYFWAETELRGQRRTGHLIRGKDAQ
ncbi:MAG: cupin domain-containing protein [Verrucomicrobiota bacterium]|nr:cupin domain-containing protein [Verrucomicrobiota bacterium]